MSQRCPVSGKPGENGDGVAHLEGDVLPEPGSCEHIRRIAFDFPTLHGTVRFLRIGIHLAMRVGPLDLRDRAFYRDRLVAVVFRTKRMMRPINIDTST